MTKSTNFATALHIMAALGVSGDTPMTSDILARSVQTNPGLIRRVLAKLVRGGLVESQRGKHGGSTLARAPSRITLREIYEAVNEGQVLRVSGKKPQRECQVSCNIQNVLCEVFEEAEEAMKQKLGTRRLSGVISQLN